MALEDGATGYNECSKGSGPTCPQPRRAAMEDGSEDGYLPPGNQGSEGCQGGDFTLSLFTDVGYTDICNDRRSVSGVAVMLGNTAVSASSTMQHYVTPSTSEAEYVAMAHRGKCALAIKTVLEFVQLHLSGRGIAMYEDNEVAKGLAENARVLTTPNT